MGEPVPVWLVAGVIALLSESFLVRVDKLSMLRNVNVIWFSVRWVLYPCQEVSGAMDRQCLVDVLPDEVIVSVASAWDQSWI